MLIDNTKIERFSTAIQNMMLMMQQVDNSCLEVTKDLSKKEFGLVVFVGKMQRVIMRDIADFLNVPVSTTTGIVDKLVDNGYLKRSHSLTDRRIIEVELSKSGCKTYDFLYTSMFELCNKMLSDLEGNEPDKLIGLLEKVTSNLSKHTPQNIS
jgi:DNA-binding MarR family transcriptional regulator